MRNLCEIDLCQQPQNVCLIKPKDFDLLRCGVPEVPQNARHLDLYRVYVYSTVLGAAGAADGSDIKLDEKKSVDALTDFYLHKISFIGTDPPEQASGYYVRFQWPGGRYSSNKLQDVQTFLGSMWTKNERDESVGIRIPGGDMIGIGLQNFAEESVNVTILFEGVSRFYLRGDA